jgi:hypothetical protein
MAITVYRRKECLCFVAAIISYHNNSRNPTVIQQRLLNLTVNRNLYLYGMFIGKQILLLQKIK